MATEIPIGTATYARIGGGVTYDGMDEGTAGQHVLLHNYDGGGSLTLVHESGSATADGKKFYCTGGSDLSLGSGYFCLCVYDTTAARWFVCKLIG